MYAYNYHAPSGLTPKIKSSSRSYESQKGEDFVAESVNRYAGEITISGVKLTDEYSEGF